jgi:protein AroM
MAPRLGVVLIGQSPRSDIEAQLRGVLGNEVDIELRGALDGLSPAELDAAAPLDDADTLIAFVPLERRGSTVDTAGRRVSKRIVEDHANAVIQHYSDAGVKVSMLFCAGDFPHVSTEGVFVLPSNVMTHVVDAVFTVGRLGVFMPVPEQRDHFIARWTAPGRDVVGLPLLPSATDSDIDAAGAEMATLRPDFVIMDCLSYSDATKARIESAVGVPTLLAFNTVAAVLKQLA